jgi:hypothetical protein
LSSIIVYVMDGFRRYAHARVQVLAKELFFILKGHIHSAILRLSGRILLFYSMRNLLVLDFVKKFTKVQNFFFRF